MVFTPEQDAYIPMAHYRSGTRNDDGTWSYPLQFCHEQFMEAFPNVNIGFDVFRHHKYVIVKRLEDKNCICKGKSTGRPTVLTQAVVENLEEQIEHSQKKPVSKLSGQTGFVSQLSAITTYHHDKPEKTHLFKDGSKTNGELQLLNITSSSSERQKRLQPYANFYAFLNEGETNSLNSNGQSDFTSYRNLTPFLKSNALPGPFRPIIQKYSNQNNKPSRQNIRISNPQGLVFNKLAFVKSTQSEKFLTRSPSGGNEYNFQRNNDNFQVNNPSKTTIETFTTKSIDIPSETVTTFEQYNTFSTGQVYEEKQNPISFRLRVPVVFRQYRPIFLEQKDVNQHYTTNNERPLNIKNHFVNEIKYDTANNFVVEEGIKEYQSFSKDDEHKENHQQFHIIGYASDPNNHTNFSMHKSTESQAEKVNSFTPIHTGELLIGKYKNHPASISNAFNSNFPSLKFLQTPKTQPEQVIINEIDNSRGILIKILNMLRKQQKSPKPIIVESIANGNTEYEESNSGNNKSNPKKKHENVYLDTPEGGTPGKPGIDYPALYSIPQTSFNCKTQRYKGFFGDPETKCQVWHYCDLNGGQASFLCPNGTIFSQIALTCDWWYNVKCSSTAQQYVLNERLYKYILPISPKFPEDYMGPLVDKYLTLKFEEMEAKMQKERKGKVPAEEINTEDSEMVFETTAYPKETLETIEDSNSK